MIRRAATTAAARRIYSPAYNLRCTDCFIKGQGSMDPITPCEEELIPMWPPLVDRIAKYTAFQASSKMDKLSDHNDVKPTIFLNRSIHGNCVLTPISVEDDGSLSPKYSIKTPFEIKSVVEEGTYCSNGLFCYPVGDELFVWNPTTLETRKLPNSPHNTFTAPGFRKINDLTATWVDPNPKSDDYKVIRFYSYVHNHVYLDHPLEIELYSLKTDSWKRMIHNEALYSSGSSHCYINGVIHLVPCHARSSRFMRSLLSFDFRTELFSTLPLPEIFGPTLFLGLPNYNGQPSLLYPVCPPENDDVERIYRHYVMRNNGELDIVGEYHVKCGESPLRFARNGELLLFLRHYEDIGKLKLAAFDSTTGEFKDVPGCESDWCSVDVFELHETFVKLKPASSSASGEQGKEDEDGLTIEAVM